MSAAATVGPFGTEREVFDAIGWDSSRQWPTDAHNELALREACHAAGVELGAYDQRIVAWLAGVGPQTCAVVAGLILRAAEAGS